MGLWVMSILVWQRTEIQEYSSTGYAFSIGGNAVS